MANGAENPPSAQDSTANGTVATAAEPPKYPEGVVLGKDGKPYVM